MTTITNNGALSSGINLARTQNRAGGNALIPVITGGITGRLIPQKGGRITKDEYLFDVATLKYKVARINGWLKLIPGRGTSLNDYPTMYVWDPVRDIALDDVLSEVSLTCKGLLDNVIPDPVIVESVSLQTVTISDPSGSGTLSIAFLAPQTSYKYIVRGDPLGIPKFNAITNSDNRPIKILRWVSSTNPTQTVPGTAYQRSLSPLLLEFCESTTSHQVGAYYGCEDVCIKTLQSPFSV